MKKIFAVGMFFLAISLVIGVTWVGPIARTNPPALFVEDPPTPPHHEDRHVSTARVGRSGT